MAKLSNKEKFLLFNLLNEVEDKSKEEKRAVTKLSKILGVD